MLGHRTLRKSSSPHADSGQYQPLQVQAQSPLGSPQGLSVDVSPHSSPSSGSLTLADDDPRPASPNDTGPAEMTPLPYPAIIALCMGRFAEGLMFGVILPYINEMVHGMGVKQEDLGKWSAAAVSSGLPDCHVAQWCDRTVVSNEGLL